MSFRFNCNEFLVFLHFGGYITVIAVWKANILIYMRLIRSLFFLCLSSFISTLLDSAQLISGDNRTFPLSSLFTFYCCLILPRHRTFYAVIWCVFFCPGRYSLARWNTKEIGFFHAQSIVIHDLSNATIQMVWDVQWILCNEFNAFFFLLHRFFFVFFIQKFSSKKKQTNNNYDWGRLLMYFSWFDSRVTKIVW